MTDLRLFVSVGSLLNGILRVFGIFMSIFIDIPFVLTCVGMKLLYPKKSLWERSYMVKDVFPFVLAFTVIMLCATIIAIILQ